MLFKKMYQKFGIFLLFVVITILQFSECADVEDELIFVNVLYQDENSNSKNVYKLNHWLRKRYTSLLPEEYIQRNSSIQLPTKSLEHLDVILYKKCHRYNNVGVKMDDLENVEYSNINLQLKSLYKYISKHLGKNISNLHELENFYCTLYSKNSLPNWTGKIFPDKQLPWSYLAFNNYCYVPMIQRSKIEYLLSDIFERFMNVTRRGFLYFNHRILINPVQHFALGNLLMTFNAYDATKCPPDVNAIIFEMRHSKNTGYYISAFYKKDIAIFPITMLNCEFRCPLNKIYTEWKNDNLPTSTITTTTTLLSLDMKIVVNNRSKRSISDVILGFTDVWKSVQLNVETSNRFKEVFRGLEDNYKALKNIERSTEQHFTTLNTKFNAMAITEHKIDKNFVVMDRQYNMIKRIELKVDRSYKELKDVHELVKETQKNVKEIRIEIRQGFERILCTITDSVHMKPLISKIKKFIDYYEGEKDRINKLSRNNYFAKLEEKNNNILHYLKNSRIPGQNSLWSPLCDIIDQNYAIPINSNDTSAFDALYALFYGTKTYVSVLLFLLEKYAHLADYHYRNNNFNEFNQYSDIIQTNYQEFKDTLLNTNKNITLIDKVINILITVKNKQFINDTTDGNLYNITTDRIVTLNKIKHNLKELQLPFITDVPITLTGKPEFKLTNLKTPIGEWKTGVQVSYALQYRDDKHIYSKIGKWSKPLIVNDKACPFLTVPVDRKRRTRLIFRKFNDNKPKLVGIIDDVYQTKFLDINRDVYDAISRFDEAVGMNETKLLIEHNANVNVVFENDRNAIHAAAQSNNVRIAKKYLLKNNDIDINAKDQNGFTAMHIAAEAGHEEFIRLLLATDGIDINANTKEEKQTPLHIAAVRGYENIVKILLRNNLTNLHVQDNEGFTPFHSAIFGGLPVLRVFLTDTRIDINAKTKDNLTALHLATINNYLDVTRVLVSYYRNISDEIIMKRSKRNVNVTNLDDISLLKYAETILNKNSNINVKDSKGYTPLHTAVQMGHNDIVKLLMDNYADVNMQSDNDKQTPLHLAIKKKNTKAVETLLRSFTIDTNMKNQEGFTPLHTAVSEGETSVIEDLLANRETDLNVKSNMGITPLHLASLENNVDGNEILMKTNRVNLNARSYGNLTSYHFAAMFGHVEIIKALIHNNNNNNKMDINAVSVDGWTPLHFAVAMKNDDVVAELLKSNVINVNAQTKYTHDTPLHIAVRTKQENTIRMLLNNGGGGGAASISLLNAAGQMPIHEAILTGKIEIVRMLIERDQNSICTKNKNNDSPVHIAARKGYVDLVTYFLSEKNIKNHCETMYSFNSAGQAAIHEAIVNDRFEILRTFVDHNASVIFYRNKHDQLPICLAAEYASINITKYLVGKGAYTNFTANSYCETPIYYAIKNGHLDVVKYLTNENIININNNNKTIFCYNDETLNITRTLLHWSMLEAAEYNQLDVMKYLVNDRNGSVYMTQEWNNLLHVAAKYGSLSVVSYLIDNKNKDTIVCGGNCKNKELFPLKISIENGHLNVVKYLIQKRINRNRNDHLDNTPLHWAIRKNNLHIVKYLVKETHANVTAKNLNGDVPLLLTSQCDCLDVVKYFLNECKMSINEINYNGNTLLFNAVMDNNFPLIKYLVNVKRDNINRRNNFNETAFLIAAEYADINVIRYLVEEASANIFAKQKTGRNALFYATANNHIDTVKYLVQKQLNINETDDTGMTVVHVATQKEHLAILKYLIQNNANISVKNNNGQNALHYAVLSNKLDIVKYLVTMGLKITVRDCNGNTLLHVAAQKGCLNVVKYLIENGLSAVDTNTAGKVPLHLAVDNYYWFKFNAIGTIKYFIEEKNVNVNIKDDNGKTPLYYAQDKKIIQYLIAKGAV